MSLNILKRKSDAFDFELVRSCKTCLATFQGRYCNRCGEKVIEPWENSFLNFLGGLLNAFTFVEGKFFRSLKLLFFRPGQLSRNIADGIQVPYMKMISLFFLANFFYFLFPGADSFNSTLYAQLHLQRYSGYATEQVNKHLVSKGETWEEFKPKYESQSTNLAKLMLILPAFVFAVSLSWINHSKKFYFSEHLLLSLEFFVFLILVVLVILLQVLHLIVLMGSLLHMDWHMLVEDAIGSAISACFLGYFMFRAHFNFYGQKWWWASVRTVTLGFAFYFILMLYRGMLFLVTMWTL